MLDPGVGLAAVGESERLPLDISNQARICLAFWQVFSMWHFAYFYPGFRSFPSEDEIVCQDVTEEGG